MMRPYADTAAVDYADLQGNILRGYAFPFAAYVFVRVEDAAAGRAWLADVVPRVTTAAPWEGDGPSATLNLAFTYAGLEALGVGAEVLGPCPDDFRQGMAARADELGDRGPDAPESWEDGLGTGAAHVLVMVNARDEASLDDALASVHGGLGSGLTVVHEQRGAALAGNREHFGFSDGFSQPAIRGDGIIPLPGQGTPEKGGRWSELPLGEFLLGHEDADGAHAAGPAGPLGQNATFMVYRKLHQHVGAFRSMLASFAAGFGGDEELLAAKIVGRFRDGTPLELCPEGAGREKYAAPDKINDFRYEDDLDGRRCPIGAHVRRTNPRDALGWHGTRSRRHRMIRRGMPYGPLLSEGAEDDGADRGLVFACFVASLSRQFETVQGQWCGDGNIFGLGDDKDFLLFEDTRDTAKMTVQGDPPRFLAPQPRLVTLRGGEYLLVPSMTGLRTLAA